MKLLIPILVLSVLMTFVPFTFAADCSSISTNNKIFLKLSGIKDTVQLFLLMNPGKQIPYRLARADALYQQSRIASDENLAYAYVLRGEDHMTRLVSLMRTMSNSESLDIQKLEQSVKAHAEDVTNMKSACDWQTIKQFIQGNREIMQQLYYLRLPTDTNMHLLKENQSL